ncbi:unnamed protein product [Mycena citricolor]|uniref:Transcriptional coactivator p15 (PC4) C-terminal domain-containing protein n=1 Tax=Mycena citricolor TaxID=2018698 RepID=A0AAD2HTS2_9AGAR|nr:unnamed protein product [Mycena citricolor]
MAPKRKSLADDSDEEEQSLATSSKPNSKAPKKTKVDLEETTSKPPTAKKPKYPNPDSTPERDHDVLIQTSPDGSKFIELGKTKRVTVREFKGSTFIDIREFYVEKGSGDMKPGKKGISLTVDQASALCKIGAFARSPHALTSGNN